MSPCLGGPGCPTSLEDDSLVLNAMAEQGSLQYQSPLSAELPNLNRKSTHVPVLPGAWSVTTHVPVLPGAWSVTFTIAPSAARIAQERLLWRELQDCGPRHQRRSAYNSVKSLASRRLELSSLLHSSAQRRPTAFIDPQQAGRTATTHFSSFQLIHAPTRLTPNAPAAPLRSVCKRNSLSH